LTPEASECDHILQQQDPFAAPNEARLAFDRHAGGGLLASCRQVAARRARPAPCQLARPLHDEDRADAQQHRREQHGNPPFDLSLAGQAQRAPD
jgi:hypothetical protein